MTERPNQIAIWETRACDVDVLRGLFIAPAWIAAKLVLLPKMAGMMRDWLRKTEALFRRTLFLDALMLAPSTLKPKFRTRTKSARTPQTEEDPDDPSTWRASFKLLPPASTPTRRLAHPSAWPRPRPVGETYERWPREMGARPAVPLVIVKSAPPKPSYRWPYAAMPLARRFEALIRVVADPGRYAALLARRLNRENAQRLIAPLKRSPANRYGWSIDELQGECERAVAALNSS